MASELNSRIVCISGKGGVGKSVVSSALALDSARRGFKTLLIDSDKSGQAIARTLSPEGKIQINERGWFETGIENLMGAALFDYGFQHILQANTKEAQRLEAKGVDRDEQFERYMAQFPGDYGLIAFNDMCSHLFGVFTSPNQVARLVTLSNHLHTAEEREYQNIFLDLRPTTATSEMLINAVKAAYSIENMAEYGRSTLWTIEHILKKPDVTRFLETDFMTIDAPKTAQRFRTASNALTQADFVLVGGEEREKTDELLYELIDIVDGIDRTRIEVAEEIARRDGKEIGGIERRQNVLAYVMNNLRVYNGEEQESQRRQIARVEKAGERRGIPTIQFQHNPFLGGIDHVSDEKRRGALIYVGGRLSEKIGLYKELVAT